MSAYPELIFSVLFILLLVLPLTVMVAYQYILFFFYFKKDGSLGEIPQENKKFVILLPAHNEEKLIKTTLDSLSVLDYPNTKYEILVIADNCSDNTANITVTAGIKCLIRNNPKKQGKGYALEWALKQIENTNFDALVVIDADTTVDRNLLKSFNQYLNKGYKAVQAANIVHRHHKNKLSGLFALGNVIKNYFVYWPKSKIGSSAYLLGTGMCFAKELCGIFYSDKHSVSEDIEFSFRLIKHGVKIVFTADTYVETIYPDNIKTASKQRLRWGSGTFVLLKKYFPYFLFKGLFKGDFTAIDTALTLLIWSKPMTIALFTLALFAGFFVNKFLMFVVLILFVLQTLYILLGIIPYIKLGYRLKGLFLAPFYIPQFMFVFVLALLGVDKNQWTRTER